MSAKINVCRVKIKPVVGSGDWYCDKVENW